MSVGKDHGNNIVFNFNSSLDPLIPVNTAK